MNLSSFLTRYPKEFTVGMVARICNPSTRGQRQEILEFKSSLGCTVRHCLRRDKELLQSWGDGSVGKVLV